MVRKSKLTALSAAAAVEKTSDRAYEPQQRINKGGGKLSQTPVIKHDGNVPAKVQSFFNALKKAEGSRLLICLKGYPDPDNIATSIALKWMSRCFQIETDVVYFEEISHHENRALVKN